MNKISNKEDKLVLLQNALITYNKAISSLDIDLPLNEQKYKKNNQKKRIYYFNGTIFSKRCVYLF